ncbi:hypothetical protein Vafri_15487 [Volvox africanus]|uniref:SPX domain-containing protein n=1 Tax=Volvox africanus TaxID=51714 RepID=A0A8J4BLK7_9CHLO|nr:hypothetical protein Vafri_15487 [Volvox africanus]
MKFGKVLKVSSENMPMEMHDLFLRYKELKKQIKMIPVSKDTGAGEKQASVSPDESATGSGSTGAAITATVLSPEEQAFITTLNEDLARFNRYFIEKEEEAVIRIQALCDDLARAAAAAGLHLPAFLTNVATSLSDQDGGIIGELNLGSDLVSIAAPDARPGTAQLQQQEDEEQELEEEEAAVAVAIENPDASGRPDVEPGEAAAAASAPVMAVMASSAGQEQQLQEHQEQDNREDNHQHLHHHHHHHHHYAHRSNHHTGPRSLSLSAPHQLQEVKSQLVQFHGEMVLLLHWSLLNYAAVVKILKKHDKRTGVLLRAPYLANVLQQPFSSTTIMSRLAKRAEELIVATTQLSPDGAGGLAAGRAAIASTAAPPVEKFCRQAGSSSVQGHTATFSTSATQAAAAAAPGPMTSARGAAAAAAAADASTPTFAVEREGGFVNVSGHSEPLVGRTMHALETWANLRKNAITPSTVLAAEVEQPPVPPPPQQQQQQQQLPQVPSKRKAEPNAPEPVEPEAESAAQEAKVAKVADEERIAG